MLHFNTHNASYGITIILSALLVAGCSYEPPAIEPGTGGTGGAGGSDASSSSSTSSSSTSSSSTSSSSSGGAAEKCVNGIDDDGNTLIDCADPICSPTYKCVPSGPTDNKWSTPFHAKYMTFDAQEPPCVTNESFTVYGVGPTPDGCTACKCAISGATCTGGALTCYDSTTCGNGMVPPLAITDTSCTSIAGTLYKSCAVTKAPTYEAANAQCTVTSQSMRVAPDEFVQKLVRCDAPRNTGPGCLMGQSCALAPTPEYDWQCIAATGKQACPAEWTISLTGYTSWSDSRVCSPCSCDQNDGSCATNTVYNRHTDVACMSPSIGIASSGCTLVQPGTVSISYKEIAPIVLPQGCKSMQNGQLEKTGETTICCRPAALEFRCAVAVRAKIRGPARPQ